MWPAKWHQATRAIRRASRGSEVMPHLRTLSTEIRRRRKKNGHAAAAIAPPIEYACRWRKVIAGYYTKNPYMHWCIESRMNLTEREKIWSTFAALEMSRKSRISSDERKKRVFSTWT